jgi:hypothetical protein
MKKKTGLNSEAQAPSDDELRALCDKARLDSMELNIKRPSQSLFALILATTALARGLDMDLHTLIGAIMAAYKEDKDLVVLEKPEDNGNPQHNSNHKDNK